jgi:protein-disulfide isomerase
MDNRIGRSLVAGMLAVIVSAACSRTDDTAAPAAAATTPPAATPAPAAPEPAPVAAPIEPKLLARLARADSPVLGRVDAPVTIVEFLDPACEACRAYAPVVKQILFLYPEDVRVVVRYAAFHPGSDEAIRVIEAARKQGKFAEVLGALFDRQGEWASHSGPKPALTWDIAAENGVNLARARKDPNPAAIKGLLAREGEDIIALKVERTPTFYVNGRPLTEYGPQELMDLVASEIQRVKVAAPPGT